MNKPIYYILWKNVHYDRDERVCSHNKTKLKKELTINKNQLTIKYYNKYMGKKSWISYKFFLQGTEFYERNFKGYVALLKYNNTFEFRHSSFITSSGINLIWGKYLNILLSYNNSKNLKNVLKLTRNKNLIVDDAYYSTDIKPKAIMTKYIIKLKKWKNVKHIFGCDDMIHEMKKLYSSCYFNLHVDAIRISNIKGILNVKKLKNRFKMSIYLTSLTYTIRYEICTFFKNFKNNNPDLKYITLECYSTHGYERCSIIEKNICLSELTFENQCLNVIIFAYNIFKENHKEVRGYDSEYDYDG